MLSINHIGCLQVHRSCGCSSSTVLFSREGKTGSNCENQTPFLLWSLLLQNMFIIITKKKCLQNICDETNLLCPHLQRCVQSRWSPACCCCGSTDQTTSSSGPQWTLPLMRRRLQIQNHTHLNTRAEVFKLSGTSLGRERGRRDMGQRYCFGVKGQLGYFKTLISRSQPFALNLKTNTWYTYF